MGKIDSRSTAELGCAEKEIEESESRNGDKCDSIERLKRAQKIARIGFMDLDIKTQELYVSDEAWQVFGFDPRDNISTIDFLQLVVHPEDRAYVQKSLESAMMGENVVDMDSRTILPNGQIRWIHSYTELILDEDGNPDHLQGTVMDITERKQAEEALRALLASLIEVKGQECFDTITHELCKWFDADSALIGEIIDGSTVRAIAMEMDGERVEGFNYDLSGSPCESVAEKGACIYPRDVCRLFPQDKDLVDMNAEGYVGTPICTGEGSTIGVLCVISRKPIHELSQWRNILSVIAARAAAEIERSNSEERQELANRILRVINQPEGHENTIREILRLIKESTDFDAVGLRLRDGDDYPYYCTEGFSERFVESESSLCVKDSAFEILRGPDGSPILECICGVIIKGNTDPSLPFFTKGGSFWTNGTSKLRELVPAGGEDRIRHGCNNHGYESVALIPLRNGEECIGLLQLNDEATNRFTLEMIDFFEGVGASIGIALARSQTKAALQESEAIWRSLGENAPYIVTLLDMKGNIQFMNRTVPDLNIDEIIGTPVYDYMPLESRLKALDCHEKVRNTGEPGSYELEYVGKNGESQFFDVYVGPVMQNGDVVALVSCSIDISERKQQEEDRKLLETQVQHAHKLESLAVLAGGIAHDFNNLLMAVIGNADLALRENGLPPPVRINIEEIEKASVQASELCNQMLAYSGKGRFVVESLNLRDVVEDISCMLKASISNTAILKYNFADNLPLIDADANQIRQVIMSLITNSSEAIGMDSGIITIGTGAIECDRSYLSETYMDEGLEEGLYAYIEVADTGCGMDEETISKIFDPFFTTKFTGRGLDMAAVMGIVRGHKGVIKIESEPGKGTTIRVLFHAADKAVEEDAVSTESPIGEVRWTGEGSILLADDEDAVLEVGRKMLEVLGFDVLTAHDGREAVRIYKEHKDEVSCVILDLTMPYMGGETAFKKLRSIDKDVCIIMSSGYNEDDVTSRFDGKGLAGFIQKPYQLGVLASKLHEIFHQ